MNALGWIADAVVDAFHFVRHRVFRYERCAACGDTIRHVNAHAEGWRYATWDDGEPDMRCGTCMEDEGPVMF